MKLRIRGNSLRLRLTRAEVARLVETGALQETTQLGILPEEQFFYRLELQQIPRMNAFFRGATLTVALPKAAARIWSAGLEVGLYSEQSWGLTIAVEKDFKCLEPRPGEVDTDAFERPEGFNPKNCPISPDDTEAR